MHKIDEGTFRDKGLHTWNQLLESLKAEYFQCFSKCLKGQ